MSRVALLRMGGAILAASLAVIPLTARAQSPAYPNKPVKLVVGFSPGSTIDLTARILSEGLSRRLGVPFIVENRTGANGAIAARTVTGAEADGYTLLVSNSSSITVNPILYKDLQYDPLKDFAPISTVISVPFVLVVNPEQPSMKDVKTVSDLIKIAKQDPGRVTYGSAGNGNLMHLAGAQLASMSSTQMTHVPYRGAAPMEAALLAREIDFGFDTLSGMPHIRAGKLRAVAVSTQERWHDLPDVPSVAEQGYPGFDVSFWVGTFAPAGTPAAVVDKLNREIVAVVNEPEVRKRLQAQGRPTTQSPAQFTQMIKDELAHNAALIERAGIRLEN